MLTIGLNTGLFQCTPGLIADFGAQQYFAALQTVKQLVQKGFCILATAATAFTVRFFNLPVTNKTYTIVTGFIDQKFGGMTKC